MSANDLADLLQQLELQPETTINDLPAALAEQLASQFVLNGVDLLRLGSTNSFWRTVASDSGVWRALLAKRFGPQPDPPSPHAPIALQGWVFFPGMDSGGNDIAGPEQTSADGLPQSPASLVGLAGQLRAAAFNTNGWIKSDVVPSHRWMRFSYEPGAGLYVREELVVQQLGMALPPAPPAPAPNVGPPPCFPGWVFYPCLESGGGDIQHPATGEYNFLTSCGTLQELHAVACVFPRCIAFTTSGQLKADVTQQVSWQQPRAASNWHGMWVREEAVRQRRFLLPRPGVLVDPKLRYFHLARQELSAASDLRVAHLNGTYLARREDPAAPGSGRQVVVLFSVCWLELAGRFYGVGPGRYRLVWRMGLQADALMGTLHFTAAVFSARPLGGDAGEQPLLPPLLPQEQQQQDAAGGGGRPLACPPVVLSPEELERLGAAAGGAWFEVVAGEMEVPSGAVWDVEVLCRNTEGDWKSGAAWDWVQLVPCPPGQAGGPAGGGEGASAGGGGGGEADMT